MRLPQAETVSRSWRLAAAAVLMIILGYPGEIADSVGTRALWGLLSSVPFAYIVYELFKGLGNSIDSQPENVRGLIKDARLVTFASWGFYPIVYMAPFVGLTGGSAETVIQVGCTLADIVAKAGIGMMIYVISMRKSKAEHPELYASEDKASDRPRGSRGRPSEGGDRRGWPGAASGLTPCP